MNETKLAIQTAFISIYNMKPYEKISVSEVCAKAPVARTTFYEYYGNLGDVKAEIEDELVNGILKLAKKHHIEDKTKEPLEFFIDVMNYFKANWEQNYSFLVKQPNFDYMEKWKSGIKYDFKLRFPEKTSLSDFGLVSEVVASGVLGAYVYWMKNPNEMSDTKTLKIVLKTLEVLPNIF